VKPVTDELLLNLAAISATLLGLLVVGVLFYVETGLRRLEHAYDVFAPYVRAAARLTMGLYVVALATALALVALELAWARVVFGLTGLAVLASLVDFTRRARVFGSAIGGTTRGSSTIRSEEVAAGWSRPDELIVWACVGGALALPWILGVATPDREDLTCGILLALALGLVSTLNMLLSVFDISKYERALRQEAED
jgi:hypothetical protein